MKILVDLPPVPKERMEPFLDFLAEILAKKFLEEQAERQDAKSTNKEVTGSSD